MAPEKIQHSQSLVNLAGEDDLQRLPLRSRIHAPYVGLAKQLSCEHDQANSSPSAAMFRIDSASSSSSGATFSTSASSSSFSSCVTSSTSGVPVVKLGHLASVADMHEACEKLEEIHLADTLCAAIGQGHIADISILNDVVGRDANSIAGYPLTRKLLTASIPGIQDGSNIHNTSRSLSGGLGPIPEIVGVAILPETIASIERRKLLPTLAETLDMVGLAASVDTVATQTQLPSLPPIALPAHLQRRRRSVDETPSSSGSAAVSKNAHMRPALHGVGEVIPSSRMFGVGSMLDHKDGVDLHSEKITSRFVAEDRKHELRSNLKLGSTNLISGAKSPGPGNARVRFAD